MRNYLKKMRDEKCLTQQNVADKLHISLSYYSMIESGERQQDISMKLLMQLADIFGVPVQQLIDAENDLA